jgi:signal transduction histidine kinase
MVVEDEQVVALDITMHLRNLRYTITGMHARGEDALAAFPQERPDLVLMDIRLQGELDGVDTAGRIRDEFGIPVIMLTAYADDAVLERAKATQPYAYIVKPFDARDLRTSIEIALYRHAMEAELQAREERLHRSQKMEAIGRLAGGIAHDFNNLLTIILGHSRMILDGFAGEVEPDPGSIREDVEGIQRAALRSAALTRQLLAFSRHRVVERRPTDVNTTLADLQKMLRRLVSEDIVIQEDLGAHPSVALVDPSQLEQVIINLVVNARDAMSAGGRIFIRTATRTIRSEELAGRDAVRPGEYVEIVVSDNGSGMERETLERLFEPFFTTKEPGRGTGLGLSTVYGIISQSGGTIDVQSTPGEGSEFTVCLPLAEPEAPERRGDVPAVEADGGHETILLVEDDEAIRAILSRALRRKGYQVLEAANAGEALLQVEANAGGVDLLVSDVVMPLMSGVELAARLRAEIPELPVVLMSGYADTAFREIGQEAAHDDFIPKPVDAGELARRIRRILDQGKRA